MIDTIRITVDIPLSMKNVKGHNRIQRNLNSKYIYQESPFEYYGFTKNILVKVKNDRVILANSLPKYHQGNNILELSPNCISEALCKLSEDLGIDISKGIVRRIDFGGCIYLLAEINKYLTLLKHSDGLELIKYRSTIYFENTYRSIKFYNKVEETRSKEKAIPCFLEGRNLMKIECSIKNHFETIWGMKLIKANHLANPNFYQKMVDTWLTWYESILKGSYKAPILDQIETPTDFRRMLEYHGILKLGGIENVIDLISEAGLKNKYNRYAAREKAKEIMRNFLEIENCHLLEELNTRVREKAKELHHFI